MPIEEFLKSLELPKKYYDSNFNIAEKYEEEADPKRAQEEFDTIMDSLRSALFISTMLHSLHHQGTRKDSSNDLQTGESLKIRIVNALQ